MALSRWTTWDDVSARAGRNDKPAILVNNWTRLPKADRLMGLEEAWCGAEWPEQYLDIETPDGVQEGGVLWQRLFDMVVPEDKFVGDDGVLHPSTDLPEYIDLYRGAIEDRQAGMSWTGDRERAEWFARRFTGMDLRRTGKVEWGHLYTMTVHRDNVFAHFNGRGEDEYVVNWAWLDAWVIEDLGIIERKDAEK